MNIQVIPVLISTDPEPLVNAMNFLYSIAEMVDVLVHEDIFWQPCSDGESDLVADVGGMLLRDPC